LEASWIQRRTSLPRDFHTLAHFLPDRSLALSGLAPTLPVISLSLRGQQCLELLAWGRAEANSASAQSVDKNCSPVSHVSKLKLRAPNINAAIALAVQDELVAR